MPDRDSCLSPAASKDRLSRNAALVLLGLALLAAAIVLLSWASGLTFFQDSWDFVINRRGFTADALLQPHNEHIVLLPVTIWLLVLRVFGMTSPMPEFVIATGLLLATATVVFVYVRRRIGPWPGLMAAVVLLFLGPAWQDLLWPAQIGFVGSSLFGVGMLLALDNAERRWDRAACAFLFVSVCFSSFGLIFVLAAAVDILQRRRSRGLRRAYIVAIPLLFYALWYLGWGHDAEGHLTLHNVLVSPRYAVEGFTASLDAMLALGTIANEAVGRSQWGLPLFIVLVALAAYSLIRRRAVSPRLWPVLAAGVAFWLLAGFNYFPGREAYSSRYLYGGALFILLIAADLLKGVRIGKWALLAGVLVAAVTAGFNLVPLREGRDFFRTETVLSRSDLAGIEIAARTVEPGFELPFEIAGTSYLNEIKAGKYLTAVREFGSPAYTPAELAKAPEAGRKQADIVLAHALPVTIDPEGEAGAVSGGHCVAVPGGEGQAPLRLRPGLTEVSFPPGGPGAIRLRRFATTEYPLISEGIAAGSTTLLQIPPDGATRPWRLQAESAQGARVCR